MAKNVDHDDDEGRHLRLRLRPEGLDGRRRPPGQQDQADRGEVIVAGPIDREEANMTKAAGNASMAGVDRSLAFFVVRSVAAPPRSARSRSPRARSPSSARAQALPATRRHAARDCRRAQDRRGRLGRHHDGRQFAAFGRTEQHPVARPLRVRSHDATRGGSTRSCRRARSRVISGRMAKQSPDAMTVRTPSAILGVRGTEFVLSAND